MPKFFVTGGTGFIGTAVVDELLANGHQVVGLARSDESAENLIKKGAEVLKGTVKDLDILKKGAKETDGTIHLAYISDFANFGASGDIDFNATETIASVLEGTGKLFIWTSGLGGLKTDVGVQSNEDDFPDIEAVPEAIKRRMQTERYVVDIAARNIRSIVIRLAPTVHGEGDHGFISYLTKGAKDNGVAYYVDQGKTTWPAIHKKDAAVLYRLAAEKGRAGKVYHGSAEAGVESRAIAEAIAKKTGLEARSTTVNDLGAKLGFIGFFFGTNINSTSNKTREELGWTPKELTLVEDIEQNYLA